MQSFAHDYAAVACAKICNNMMTSNRYTLNLLNLSCEKSVVGKIEPRYHSNGVDYDTLK